MLIFLVQVSVGDLLEESNIVLGVASDIDHAFYFPDVELDLGDDYSCSEVGDEEVNDCFEEDPSSANESDCEPEPETAAYVVSSL